MIEIRGVRKVYKDLVAVNELNMTVNKGDIFGFIGPNGAGKTTTIKVLATLLKPTQGYALVCGYNVLTQADDVKRVMGYMPDSFGVYDDMKVWEYLDFFAAAYKIEKTRRKTIIPWCSAPWRNLPQQRTHWNGRALWRRPQDMPVRSGCRPANMSKRAIRYSPWCAPTICGSGPI